MASANQESNYATTTAATMPTQQRQQQELIKLLAQHFHNQFYQLASASNLLSDASQNQIQLPPAPLLPTTYQSPQQQHRPFYHSNEAINQLSTPQNHTRASRSHHHHQHHHHQHHHQQAPTTNPNEPISLGLPRNDGRLNLGGGGGGGQNLSTNLYPFNDMSLFNALGLNNQLVLSLQQQSILQAAAAAAAANGQYSEMREAFESVQQLEETTVASRQNSTDEAIINNLTDHHSDRKEILKFSIDTILGRRSPGIRTNTNERGKLNCEIVKPSLNTFNSRCSGKTNQQAPTSTPTKTTTNNEHQSTALSSLSNFVTESLDPILNSDHHKSSKHLANQQQSGVANIKQLHAHAQHNGARQRINVVSSGNNGNISQHRKSNSMEADNNNSASERESKAVTAQQTLKSTTGTTINTTLAKAPPELVQKQPAWVFCTRYSDRPSSGPRTRRAKSKDKKAKDPKASTDEKRPRTAFTSEQLDKLRQEFQANSYLDERRRKDLAERLCLNENQIKIWFQNKRAKMKKQNNQPNPLRGLLVAGGLYNHSTATSDCSESYANGNDHDEDDEDDESSSDRLVAGSGGNLIGGANSGNRKRKRNQRDDDDGQVNFRNNEAETGMSASDTAKRARLSQSGSESGGNSSRIEDLDEDDGRVISVS